MKVGVVRPLLESGLRVKLNGLNGLELVVNVMPLLPQLSPGLPCIWHTPCSVADEGAAKVTRAKAPATVPSRDAVRTEIGFVFDIRWALPDAARQTEARLQP